MTLQNISTQQQKECTAGSSELSNKETKPSLLANLAKSILIETASVAFLSKATFFCAISLSTASLIPQIALGIVIANSVCKAIRCFHEYRDLEQHERTPKCSTNGLVSFKTITQWIPPLNFAILFGTTGNLLIHESGHVAAASSVYKGLKAQITIPGLFRGAVSWTKTGLTAFGSSLGGLNSRLLVCFAGPLAAASIATGTLIAGIHLRDRFPEFSKYVILASVVTLIYQVVYALSAYWASSLDLCHDFVMLQHVGVNPVVAGICLASIPIIALVAYFRLKKSHSGHNP